jgi:hypothetical protein
MGNGEKEAMSKPKKKVFSVTKAVKQNARDRVGTPPPEQILPDDKQKAEARTAKHRTTLADLLTESGRD